MGAIINQMWGSAVIEWNVAKIVVVLLLAAAVLYLGLGFAGLMRRNTDQADERLVYRSLVKRVGFSVAALVFIMVAGYAGWFK